MRKFTQFVADTRGAEIAEFAIVIPILAVVLFGIFTVGQAMYVSSTVTKAANDALAAAQKASCGSCGNAIANGTQIGDAIEKVAVGTRLDPNNFVAFTPPYLCTANPPPTVRFASVTSSTGNTYNVQIVDGAPLDANCTTVGTRIALQYKFVPALPLAGLRTLLIPAVVQGPTEN